MVLFWRIGVETLTDGRLRAAGSMSTMVVIFADAGADVDAVDGSAKVADCCRALDRGSCRARNAAGRDVKVRSFAHQKKAQAYAIAISKSE